jgi:hypothetical protein
MSGLQVTRPEIRTVVDFDHVVNAEDAWDFHEWIWTDTKVKADKRGRRNPRMTFADWRLVRCNNTECPAQALILMNNVLNALPPVPVTAAS